MGYNAINEFQHSSRYAVTKPPMQKVGILSHTQKATDRPERYVSKNAAAAMLRRLLAVRITKTLIQMVNVQQMCQARPNVRQHRPGWCYEGMQHHLEPRINRFTIGNSEWLAYLHGYQAR